jgi:hypothetical protein
MTRLGPVGRAARGLARMRVLCAAIGCAVTWWFASMLGTYRVPGEVSALAVLGGAALGLVSLGLLAHAVVTAAPPRGLTAVLRGAVELAPLIVLNLIVLSVLSPFAAALAREMESVSLAKWVFAGIGLLSGSALLILFAIAASAAVLLGAAGVLERVAGAGALLGTAASAARRVAVLAVLVGWVAGVTVALNGALDHREATEVAAEVRAAWTIPWSGLAWIDLAPVEPRGDLRRVLLFPGRDELRPGLVRPGQRVRLRLRAGAFGLAWVERVRHDVEHQAAALLEAAPTAAVPRRALVDSLLRSGRWAEAERHTAVYARQYPGDREFVRRVASEMRRGRQPEAAARLDRLSGPAPDARAGAPRTRERG